jgi:prevent-host-death family protein
MGVTYGKPRRGRRASTVSATAAAKNFGELVDRVRETGAAYVVERKGRPIAEISPVAVRRCHLSDLVKWFEERRPLPDGYVAAVTDHLKAVNRPRVPLSTWPR